jgi:hypothetical protein
MKRGSKSTLLAAMLFGGLLGSAQAIQPIATQNAKIQNQEIKSTKTGAIRETNKVIRNVGSIPIVTYFPNFGLSPKEYGMIFGNGKSRKGKVNYARMSHNAKLKRRKA